MWKLDEETLSLIRKIQKDIRGFGYHVMLGGGVLNEGKSDKDLDLFFVPLNHELGERDRLFGYLSGTLVHKGAIRDSPDYHGSSIWHWDTMEIFEYKDKRIDVFIMRG